MDKQRIAKLLLILWIICFITLSIGTSIYISYQHVIIGRDPTVFVSGLHWFILGIIVLFFIPLLAVIRRLLRMSGSSKLRQIVSAVLFWLLSSAVLLMLCILFAYIAPETFAALMSLSN